MDAKARLQRGSAWKRGGAPKGSSKSSSIQHICSELLIYSSDLRRKGFWQRDIIRNLDERHNLDEELEPTRVFCDGQPRPAGEA
jgi:hypothetical protein